jgi:hypothetical protein
MYAALVVIDRHLAAQVETDTALLRKPGWPTHRIPLSPVDDSKP